MLWLCFGNKWNNVQAYYSPSGNVEGECSRFVWEEEFNLVCNGENPFMKSDIGLVEYTHCFTEKTYKRYYTKN